LCPQGGLPDAEFNASIGDALTRAGDRCIEVSVVCLREVDAVAIRQLAPSVSVLESFELFRQVSRTKDVSKEAVRLVREYSEVNWWELVAAERSIVDSSFLLGGLGQRSETKAYVESLVVDLARYFETTIARKQFSAVICQVVDSLIIHVFYKIAHKLGITIVALSPNAWIREDGRPGFYIAHDEFMHNSRMENIYRELSARTLTYEQRERSRRYQRTVTDFDMLNAYQSVMKRPFVVPAFSPNMKRLIRYLRANSIRDKGVEYYKIDVFSKAKANALRVWRRWRSRGRLGPKTANIPPRSVFFPMQYQPEQSTLVGGVYFANQIAVIENIAKAMPLGSTLVVKEHPRGRGSRPTWQYTHLAHFPNIMFCDATSKELIRQCDAVVTITSTIGLEAMALDKPIVVLGQCYYDFAEIVYKPQSWPELAKVLRRILVDREYDLNVGRRDIADRFFLSYLEARIPVLLNKDSASEVADAVVDELRRRRLQLVKNLDARTGAG
jgi:hypothetical protein